MNRAPGQAAKGTGTRRAGTFDAFALARTRGVLEGSFAVEALPRLADCLANDEGSLAWRIEGTRDAAGRPALAVEVDGEVTLECQRCLGTFRFPVAQRTLAVLVKSEAEADAVDESVVDEVLVAAAAVDPAELVEDELLLTLPFAPKHAEGDCSGQQD